MKILITGGNGYIAKSLAKELNGVTLITRKDFDLTSREATDIWFENKFFDIVIHTAISGGSRLKKDGGNVFYQNIQMFYNLLNNKSNFKKLISFGSGAELNMPTDPYGLSKNIINRIIRQEPNFYNIRIYGVFDENELDTRFIKSNIKRYINKKPMEIYQNKFMDFFYMKDLISLVKYYINNSTPPKISECSYKQKYSLLDIAQIINKQSDYILPIQFKKLNYDEPYNGKMTLPIQIIGLKKGIKETYKKIKNGSN